MRKIKGLVNKSKWFEIQEESVKIIGSKSMSERHLLFFSSNFLLH